MAKKKKDKAAEAETEEKEKEAPAAEGAEGAEGEGDAPKKSKKKIIIIAVLVIVLLVGGGAGAYFGGLIGGGKSEEESHEAGVELDEHGKPIPKNVFYTMPEFLVNLNTSSKQSSFLKTTVILELNGMTDIVVVEANLPRLQDSMNTYLRELRASDLAGSAGIQRLREELLLRANKALAPTKINNVLFKEIVIQ